MNMPVPMALDYLQRFFSAKYAEYFEDMRELRSDKGYGYYHRSDEVTQALRNIVHNISDTFGDMRIPEGFSSPKRFVDTLLWFENLLKDQNELFIDVFKNHQGSLQPPIPVIEISRINNEVLDAISHILCFEEIQPYLEETRIVNTDLDKAENPLLNIPM
jgi:hypothetical protein